MIGTIFFTLFCFGLLWILINVKKCPNISQHPFVEKTTIYIGKTGKYCTCCDTKVELTSTAKYLRKVMIR